MREIKYIVIHCTAGPVNQTTEVIRNYWKGKGWKKVGYHLLISDDGSYERLAPDEETTNGVEGHNSNAIHICYKGGWVNNQAIDTRSEACKKTMLTLIRTMKSRYPKALVCGHRDFSKDKNGNGIIEKSEWIKQCPSFDVNKWLLSTK